ncbi:PA2169 family four-helix-bundle protein [soil metagenome]
MENEEVVSTLKDLIRTLEDGKEGFKLAAESTDNPDMRTLFLHYAAQREQFSAELHHLSGLDGDEALDIETSLTGALHREWLNLRSALNAGDPGAILAECERGENHAVSEYRKALDLPLPTEVVHAIGAQSLEITSAHEKVKYLRDLAMAN